ncbi:MAG: DUF3390 domain-containing protein, partial [Terrimicrobiaceae bacterium]|nr:DUF3390 domain-containing protein [Terrimicrobiaceae bacterium]
LMNSPALYRAALAAGRLLQPLHKLVEDTPFDPLRAWTRSRAFPRLAPRSFHQLWRARRRQS